MNLINLAQEINLHPKKVAQTHGGEYHSPCPSCGGSDRFVIHPNKQMRNCVGSYFCRKCGIRGDSIQFCRDFLGKSFNEAVGYAGGNIPTKMPSYFAPRNPKSLLSTQITMPAAFWLQKAEQLVYSAHTTLMNHNEVAANLSKRGLPSAALQQYKIGLLTEDKNIPGAQWGLEKEILWLPKGLIIPTLEMGQVVRLKIRRHDWHPNDSLPKYIAISGSMSGLNIIGDKKKKVMFVVESELDAYALHHIVSDFAFVVAIGGCVKNIDSVTDRLAAKKHLVICHDNDEAGKNMLLKWKEAYMHAMPLPTPIGKDIGEALQQKFDIRLWITTALPTHIQHDAGLTQKTWSVEDQELIDWILRYIRECTPPSTRDAYRRFEDEIALGPESPRAKSGELQRGLRLMKKMIEMVTIR